MSLVLDAWIKACSPAMKLDQLVLLHVSDEIQTPNGATVKVSVPAGHLIDPSNQHQNVQSRTGGGFRSLRDLGTRIWPDSEPDDAADNAGARVRRLRGLPNALKQAYFPALLWTIQGGRYRDPLTGQVLNRRAVWRIPLVREAVLVPVPASGRTAGREGWTPEKGWQQAEHLLLAERQRRAVREAGAAAAGAVRAAARGMGYTAKAAEEMAAISRREAEAVVVDAWDEHGERRRVQQYLAHCRAIQEHQALGDVETAEARPTVFIPGAYTGGGSEHADALAAIGQRAAADRTRTLRASSETSPESTPAGADEEPPLGDEEPPSWDEEPPSWDEEPPSWDEEPRSWDATAEAALSPLFGHGDAAA